MKYFNRLSELYLNLFNSSRIQKISVTLSHTCPRKNSDSSCIYCSNNSFLPFYVRGNDSLYDQIQVGKKYTGERYNPDKFLIYVQGYSTSENHLRNSELASILSGDDLFAGIIVGLRPDYINEKMIETILGIAGNKKVFVEIGIESFSDKVLEKINRGHEAEEIFSCFEQLSRYPQIITGAHLIFGLPGEENDFYINTAANVNLLNINYLKIHHLQVIKNTILDEEYQKNKNFVKLYEVTEYINLLCNFMEIVDPGIYFDRLINEVPSEYLVGPFWNRLKSNDILKMIQNELESRNSFQGKFYKK